MRSLLLLTSFLVIPFWAEAQVAAHVPAKNSVPAKASITGFVTDAATGELLPAANISLSYRGGTSSDAGGNYSLHRVTPGTYVLRSTYIGYHPFERKVKLAPGDRLRINITMQPQDYTFKEVVVSSQADKEWRHQIGAAHMDLSKIKGLPSLFQQDLFRSLQLLPGVASSSDFSSGLYIRGGSPDQTLILFDQAPVYNPSHFFGFFSTFNPEAVGDMQLFKGNYPARYGGRLGSVLSLSGKQGSRDRTGGSVSLGLLAASVSLNGPLPGDKGSWMLAARRSTMEPLLGLLQQSMEDVPDRFYLLDLNGSLNLVLDPKNRLSLSMYSGVDRLSFPFAEEAGLAMDYGNQVVSATWKHLLSDRLLTTFNVSGSRYFNYPSFRAASTQYRRFNNIREFSFRSDTDYFLSDTHRLSIGLHLGRRAIRLQDHYNGNPSFSGNVQGWNTSFYLQDKWSLYEDLDLTPGLRLMRYGSAGAFHAEPRLSLKYRPSESVSLQGAWGRYSQDLTLISNESFTGLDVWLPAGHGVPVARGDQFALGFQFSPRHPEREKPNPSCCPPERAKRVEGSPVTNSSLSSGAEASCCHSEDRETSRRISRKQSLPLTLNVEFYYRTMRNLFEPDPLLLDRTGLPYRDLFRFGEGHAYGMEASLEKAFGRTSGFLGYTYSKTFRRFPEVSSEFYPTRFDRTHNLNLVLEHELNASWSVTGVFSYTSGAPYTPVVARSLYGNSPLSDRAKFMAITGPINSARMPAYHRLDLAVTRKGTFLGMGRSELNLQLLNAYSRRNTWFYTYDLNKGTDYRDSVQLLPMLPSITYNLYF